MPDDQLQAITERRAAEALVVDVAGFEGPLDVLLTLARTQRVDLRQISVLALAEQYLGFVAAARRLRIELAADYLVMAAWLAYLKSRLLLPPDPSADEPSGEDLAAHLAFQLERLEGIRRVAAMLMARDQLGRDVFARGAPETLATRRTVTHEATLLDVMKAYARIKTKEAFEPFHLRREAVYTMEDALERMRSLLGTAQHWSELAAFLPEGWDQSGRRRRAAVAATFAAALELVRDGALELRQDRRFGPIELKDRST
ncbi:MAG: ScpA family protein [Pseudomonadota bacterium]